MNKTIAERPVMLPSDLYRVIEEAASAAPDRVALSHGSVEIPYAMFIENVRQVSRSPLLRAAEGGLIAIVGGRSWQRCTVVCAAWRRDVGVLSIDPDLPQARKLDILSQCPIAFLVPLDDLGASAELSEVVASFERRPAVDQVEENWDIAEVAYIVPTSGTTGVPKCVALPADTLMGLMTVVAPLPEGKERVSHLASPGFDVGFQEIATTLGSGYTLVVGSNEVRSDPFKLAAFLDAERVERAFLPTRALLALAIAADSECRDLANLEQVVVGGEQLFVTDEIRRLFTNNGARLINQYGPTESHAVCQTELPEHPSEWPTKVPIGKSFPGISFLREIRAGVAGEFTIGDQAELLISGSILAHGYMGNQELTSEKFSRYRRCDADVRCYRTGDEVRLGSGGEFEFCGRLDEQVKLSGYRVEPGEVEAVVHDLPGVESVAVLAWPRPNPSHLVGVFVADPASITEELLADHCRARLPHYSVPRRWVRLETMPTGLSGKTDRVALKRMLAARSESSGVP